MIYNIELTENQIRVMQIALEEYFRLRLGQDFDFSMEMAFAGRDFRKENNRSDKEFDLALQRRNHIRSMMRAVFQIAFEPTGYLEEKTDEMMIAECMWDAIRFARGLSRFDSPFQIGSEPSPKITVVEKEHEVKSE